MNPIGYNDIISDNVEKGIKTLITLWEQFKDVLKSGDNIYTETLNTLKIEIDSLNKSMKDLNSTAQKKQTYTDQEINELKQLAAELEKLKADYDNLKNAQKQATAAQKQNTQATEETAGSIAHLKKQLADLNKQKLNATEEELKNLGAEASKVQTEIKRLETVFKSGGTAARNLAGSYDELSNRNRELKRALKELPDVFGANAAKAEQMKIQIQANDKTLKEFDKTIGESFRNVGNYASAFDGILGALSNSGGIVGGLAGVATGVGAVTIAIDFLVNGFTQVSEAVEQTNKELAQTSNIIKDVGVDTDLVTAKVKTLSKSMGVEYSDMLETVQIFSKNFGITQLQALDLIQNEYIDSGDILTKNLDKVAEYSSKLRASGLTAAQSLNVATEGIRQGVFGENFLMAIEEATLSVREFTKAQEDAVKPLGKAFGENLKKQVDSGKTNTIQALLAIREQAKKVGLSVTQEQTIIADFLKSGGEALGTIENFYGILDNSLKENNKTLTEQQIKLQNNLKVQEAYNLQLIEFSKNFQGLGTTLQGFATQLATSVFSGFNDLIELLKQFYNASVAVTEIIGEVFGVEGTKIITTFTTVITKAFNLLLDYILATPRALLAAGKFILSTIGGIANAIKVFGLEIGTFTNSIKDFASGNIGLNELTKKVSGATERITESFSFGYDRIKSKFDATKEAAKENTTELDKNTKSIDTNTKATNSNSAAKEKQFLTLTELGKQQIAIQKELDKELAKDKKLIRPEFLAAKKKELENVKKLIDSFKFETTFDINPDTNVQLDGENPAEKKAAEKLEIQKDYYAKDAEIFKGFRLKNEITEQEYQDKLFELEKANIEKQLAAKEKLKEFDLEYYKLKNELLKLDTDRNEKALQKTFDNYNSFINKFVKDSDLKFVLNLIGSAFKGISDFKKGKNSATDSILNVLGSVSGFSEGGYTGAGTKYDPAGIVHKGEVVFSQENIKRLGGVSNVENIRNLNFDSVNLGKFYEPLRNIESKPLQVMQGPQIDIDSLAVAIGSAIGGNFTKFDVENLSKNLIITQQNSNLVNRTIVKKQRKSI